MSLFAFQQALAELVASVALCQLARGDMGEALGRYDLTQRERERLQHMVHHRGMAVNCALHRANRLTPLYSFLPLSCFLLDSRLRTEVEVFWSAVGAADLQFQHESQRFAAFLQRRLRSGDLVCPMLEDILRFESTINAFRYVPRRRILEELQEAGPVASGSRVRLHPLVRVARFQHDPTELLSRLGNRQRPGPELPVGEFYLLLDARRNAVELQRISAELGRILTAIDSADGHAVITGEASASLLESDLLVSAIFSS